MAGVEGTEEASECEGDGVGEPGRVLRERGRGSRGGREGSGKSGKRKEKGE